MRIMIRKPTPLRLACLGALLLLGASPAVSELIPVSDLIDDIPAPVGSLRWAIELSESSPGADSIEFLIDGGTIELVAPLPDLTDGRLAIGFRQNSVAPPPDHGLKISGILGVQRAIAIRSAGNQVSGLEFVDFSGEEILLLEGNAARNNVISSCVFGVTAGLVADSAAIRIKRANLEPDAPTRNTVQFSRFQGVGTGIVIEGRNSTGSINSWNLVRNNWFGTDAFGAAGAGLDQAIRTASTNPVLIESNRISGPGGGILLGAGSDLATVSDNDLGLRQTAGTTCLGFNTAAIHVERSNGVMIRNNRIACSEIGIYLDPDTTGAQLRDNRIGGPAPDNHRTHGIFIDGASETLVRRNRIQRNNGFGIVADPGPSTTPESGSRLACNSVFDNVAGGLSLPASTTLPPALLSATVLNVLGDQPTVPAWVELFEDRGDQAERFQGAVLVGDFTPSFRHQLPVLDLQIAKSGTGAVISFDRTVFANHTATATPILVHETSELSAALPVEAAGLAFDLIRGDLANLGYDGTGGTSLGPVVCLDSAIDPDTAITPNPFDNDRPASGHGFFYLSRRRGLVVNQLGTYDPAVCLTDLDEFVGDRQAESGDCPS